MIMSKMRYNEKLIRADLEFSRELDKILKNRIEIGKEDLKRLNGTRRFTKAIIRHPLWPTIEKDIIVANLEDDRKLRRNLK